MTAALLFVGYDVLADPNHLHRGGWTYPGGGAYLGVPLQNFAAWFAPRALPASSSWNGFGATVNRDPHRMPGRAGPR